MSLYDKRKALGTLIGATYGTKIYYPEDVKEFIRKLKDSFNDDRITPEYVLEKIDKLAGKELLE